MHCAQGMMKTGMQRAGINQMRHPHLLNIAQPLKIGMFNKVEYQFRWDADKTVNRVVDYFLFIQFGYKLVQKC